MKSTCVATLAVGLSLFAPAFAQVCDPMEDVLTSAIASATGESFSALAAIGDEVLTMSPDDARTAAAAGLSHASAGMYALASQTSILAQLGIEGGEEIAQQMIELGQDLATSSDAFRAQSYGTAGAALGSVSVQIDGMFNMDGQTSFPSILRTTYQSAVQDFAAAAAIMNVMERRNVVSAFVDEAFSSHEPGSGVILETLNEFEAFTFPSDIPGEWLPVPTNFEGKWGPGTMLRQNLESLDGMRILDDLVIGGSLPMLEIRGDQAALASLTQGAASLVASNDYLSGLLLLEEFQCESCSGCVWGCDNDPDCGPCACTKIGFGTDSQNPADIDESIWAVELVLSIEVEVGGVTSPTSPEELRDAIGEAYKDLAKKVVDGQGHLYGMFAKPKCIFSLCWYFWYESECETSSEWVQIPLEFIQAYSSYRGWTPSAWRDAMESLEKELENWCEAAE